jgi:hypothetical protein
MYFIRNVLVYNKTGHVPINVTSEVCSRIQYCRGKAIILTYSERVIVALVIQHAMRMRHIILFSVASPFLSNFCTSSHKRHDLGESLFKPKSFFNFLYKFRLKYFSF